MDLVEIPLGSPAELLAWDEALLAEVESGDGEFLWFWESPVPFVVVGYGQTISREVDLTCCHELGVPVLRRCSGGGTVVQGPGCLNYGVALRWDSRPPLQSVTGTNQWVMGRQAAALNRLTGGNVVIRGHTDLALLGSRFERKFSGNAQRRTRRALLFHGTILYGMDLNLVSKLLPVPQDRPEYRASRSHADFITNLPVSPESIRAAILGEWQVSQKIHGLPFDRHQHFLMEHYLQEDWHQRRRTNYSPI